MTTPPPDWKAAAAVATLAREDAKRLAGGTNAFAAQLYAQLAAGNGGNVFFSPASIAFALAMAYAGARNATAAEIATVLALRSVPPERLDAAFATLAAMANSAAGVELRMASALFGRQHEQWRPEFLALLKDQYGAPMRELDFAADPRGAVIAMNQWARQHTKGMVDAIVEPGSIEPTTRLVLANAVYLKGSWATPFEKLATRDAPFHLFNGAKVPVPLMFVEGDFRLFEMPGAQILDLPFESSPLTMSIVLPRTASGLPNGAADIATLLLILLEQLDRMRVRTVEVHLPRFRIDARAPIGGALRTLGIELAFDPRHADFSGMAPSTESLSLSAVQHRAVLEVNEAGAVAAAATSLGVVELSVSMAPRDRPVFRADRPFLIVIRDARTNNILFLGRVMDPRF